jgi:DNA-binding transcriptional ArsR family regulator
MVAWNWNLYYRSFMTLHDIAKRMAALGNETRLGIYRLLVRAGENGLPVTSVQKRLDVPASTLSHHLHKLIEVGLVHQDRRGTSLICRADYCVMEQTFYFFARECCADDEMCCDAFNDPKQELMK